MSAVWSLKKKQNQISSNNVDAEKPSWGQESIPDNSFKEDVAGEISSLSQREGKKKKKKKSEALLNNSDELEQSLNMFNAANELNVKEINSETATTEGRKKKKLRKLADDGVTAGASLQNMITDDAGEITQREGKKKKEKHVDELDKLNSDIISRIFNYNIPQKEEFTSSKKISDDNSEIDFNENKPKKKKVSKLLYDSVQIAAGKTSADDSEREVNSRKQSKIQNQNIAMTGFVTDAVEENMGEVSMEKMVLETPTKRPKRRQNKSLEHCVLNNFADDTSGTTKKLDVNIQSELIRAGEKSPKQKRRKSTTDVSYSEDKINDPNASNGGPQLEDPSKSRTNRSPKESKLSSISVPDSVSEVIEEVVKNSLKQSEEKEATVSDILETLKMSMIIGAKRKRRNSVAGDVLTLKTSDEDGTSTTGEGKLQRKEEVPFEELDLNVLFENSPVGNVKLERDSDLERTTKKKESSLRSPKKKVDRISANNIEAELPSWSQERKPDENFEESVGGKISSVAQREEKSNKKNKSGTRLNKSDELTDLKKMKSSTQACKITNDEFNEINALKVKEIDLETSTTEMGLETPTKSHKKKQKSKSLEDGVLNNNFPDGTTLTATQAHDTTKRKRNSSEKWENYIKKESMTAGETSAEEWEAVEKTPKEKRRRGETQQLGDPDKNRSDQSPEKSKRSSIKVPDSISEAIEEVLKNSLKESEDKESAVNEILETLRMSMIKGGKRKRRHSVAGDVLAPKTSDEDRESERGSAKTKIKKVKGEPASSELEGKKLQSKDQDSLEELDLNALFQNSSVGLKMGELEHGAEPIKKRRKSFSQSLSVENIKLEPDSDFERATIRHS
ncbi:titin homolog isoform X2 [Cylas formicarius]|uniref:titin homolog isoform X2 n=1 Tax=Cylas formicarius TaxID=197179 RepID=UPI002958C039|nr:titin homolog isoform X2 [Cylas formicarius]